MKELIYHRLLLPAVERAPDKVSDPRRRLPVHAGRSTSTGRAGSRMRSAHQLGVRRDDRFAVMALNSHQYLELYHAAFLGAGVINPLNLRLAPKELEYILARLRHEGRASSTRSSRGVIDQVREDSGHRARRADRRRRRAARRRRTRTCSRAAHAGDPRRARRRRSGHPHVHGRHHRSAQGCAARPAGRDAQPVPRRHARGGSTTDDVYLHQTPMFHAASMGGMLGVPAIGGDVGLRPAVRPGAVLDAIEQHQVTMTVMVPTMIGMLHGASRVPARAAREPRDASPTARRRCRRRCSSSCSRLFPELDIYQGYGMTESVGGAHGARPRGAPRRRRRACARRAGRCPASRSRSRTTTATPVAAGRDRRGVRPRRQLHARVLEASPRRPRRRSAAAGTTPATPATSTSEGYLFLVDRVKDMIVTGGENVYSVEVENAIATHPGVAQVAVIGIPSEKWGEAVHAIVVLQRRRAPSPRPRSSSTPASRSPATRCRRPSRSAPSRSRCPAR